MAQKWQHHDDYWSQDYPWFVMDNSLILYAFKTKAAAGGFLRGQFIDYMLVTHLDHLIHNIGLDPHDIRNWESNKMESIDLLRPDEKV